MSSTRTSVAAATGVPRYMRPLKTRQSVSLDSPTDLGHFTATSRNASHGAAGGPASPNSRHVSPSGALPAKGHSSASGALPPKGSSTASAPAQASKRGTVAASQSMLPPKGSSAANAVAEQGVDRQSRPKLESKRSFLQNLLHMDDDDGRESKPAVDKTSTRGLDGAPSKQAPREARSSASTRATAQSKQARANASESPASSQTKLPVKRRANASESPASSPTAHPVKTVGRRRRSNLDKIFSDSAESSTPSGMSPGSPGSTNSSRPTSPHTAVALNNHHPVVREHFNQAEAQRSHAAKATARVSKGVVRSSRPRPAQLASPVGATGNEGHSRDPGRGPATAGVSHLISSSSNASDADRSPGDGADQLQSTSASKRKPPPKGTPPASTHSRDASRGASKPLHSSPARGSAPAAAAASARDGPGERRGRLPAPPDVLPPEGGQDRDEKPTEQALVVPQRNIEMASNMETRLVKAAQDQRTLETARLLAESRQACAKAFADISECTELLVQEHRELESRTESMEVQLKEQDQGKRHLDIKLQHLATEFSDTRSFLQNACAVAEDGRQRSRRLEQELEEARREREAVEAQIRFVNDDTGPLENEVYTQRRRSLGLLEEVRDAQALAETHQRAEHVASAKQWDTEVESQRRASLRMKEHLHSAQVGVADEADEIQRLRRDLGDVQSELAAAERRLETEVREQEDTDSKLAAALAEVERLASRDAGLDSLDSCALREELEQRRAQIYARSQHIKNNQRSAALVHAELLQLQHEELDESLSNVFKMSQQDKSTAGLRGQLLNLSTKRSIPSAAIRQAISPSRKLFVPIAQGDEKCYELEEEIPAPGPNASILQLAAWNAEVLKAEREYREKHVLPVVESYPTQPPELRIKRTLDPLSFV